MTDAEKTLTTPLSELAASAAPLLALTLLWHPDPQRVGQQAIGPAGAGTIELHRFLPLFRHAGEEGSPLGERSIARSPVVIRRAADDAILVTAPESSMTLAIDGARVAGSTRLTREQMARGVVLSLGGQVLLCLHWMRALPKRNPLPGLLGVSAAAVALRDEIRQVARTALPVLLLGETGTGKDVAARAIHAASPRREAPFVAVNMAALGESLAAADLFGAVKGAYTGATTGRAGLFAEAGDGTLFLDEIGDTPQAVQPMLLRVLESGEYRPLGARHVAQSQARLVAATDRDLTGRAFNHALLRRIEAFTIRVPALRERREDIGLLVRHFLQQWALQSGQHADLPPAFVAELCCHDWPGNVRQLAHVVRRAALALCAGETPRLAALVAPAGGAPAAKEDAAPPVPAAPRTALAALSEQAIVDALDDNGWQIKGAALALGISRPSLYKLLATHPQVRRAEAIPVEEIRQALRQHAADLNKCASALRTPGEALRRHARLIGLLA